MKNILQAFSLLTMVTGLTCGGFAISQAVNGGPLSDKQTGSLVLASLFITHAAALPLMAADRVKA